MIDISYITNIPIEETSGGMSGINHAAYQQLIKEFILKETIVINPGYDYFNKIVSKSKRVLGYKGNYHFFSYRRLKQIAKLFRRYHKQEVEAYFFLGTTPWINIKPDKPYFCFQDASFGTYVRIYNDRKSFIDNDLERIMQMEAEWLSGATKVFFQSHWAANQTKLLYNVSGENFEISGVGGFIDIPVEDCYKGGFNFLFVANDFKNKGGEVAVSAFKRIVELHPRAKLLIIGDRPSSSILSIKNVLYYGRLKKNNKYQLQQLRKAFAEGFALIHPTKRDINPLVILELAYFGCPAISSKQFAIPEYLKDGQTGFLMNNSEDVDDLAEKMIYLIENPDIYMEMRRRARETAIDNHTWDNVGKKIRESMKINLLSNKKS